MSAFRFTASLNAAYFDARYAADADPWQFATSTYEQAKYEATMRALPHRDYASALEIGCSIGVLTRQLADRCRRLLAVDVSDAALEQARRRCSHLPGVTFSRTRVPYLWPEGRFDLIVLSEVVYYFDAADVERLAERTKAALAPGGDIVLVHWTGDTHYPLAGDDAVAIFMGAWARAGAVMRQERALTYRLDVVRGWMPP